MSKALAILSVALAGIVVVESAHIAAMRREFSDVKSRLDRVESRQRETRRDPAARSEEPAVSSAGKTEDALPRTTTTDAQPRSTAPDSKQEEATTTALTADEIREIIEKRVDEKVKARQGEDNGFGGKKRPLDDVAKELGLDPEVTKLVAGMANEGKQQVFDLLKTTRSDGTNLVEDLVAALKTDKPQENMQAQFMRIFRENVPGTQETYFAAALRVSEGVLNKFATVLTADQLTAYRHTGVGPLDLQTGFDPFAEYFKGK